MRRCGKNLTSVTGNLEKCLRTSSSVNLGGRQRTKMREDSILAVCGLSCGLLQRRRHTGKVSVVRKLLGKKFKKYLAGARPTLVGRLVAPACALARCNNTNTNTNTRTTNTTYCPRVCIQAPQTNHNKKSTPNHDPSPTRWPAIPSQTSRWTSTSKRVCPCTLTDCHETS